ncbi:hypothetical protein CF327_g3943 [Tilletia walkeri]|nr:hypothetical protein CF327_g3943 [Tilletia walkeri]
MAAGRDAGGDSAGPSSSNTRLLHGRTRSAAARAIFASNEDPPSSSSLFGALTSLTGNTRRIPPPNTPATTDLEAQRRNLALEGDHSSPFGIGDDEDEEENQPLQTTTHTTRTRYKSSDSTQESDKIIGGDGYDGDDGLEEEDIDEDEEAQYASMAEPGSEYTSLLQLKPVPSNKPTNRGVASSSSHKPAGRLRPPDGEDDDTKHQASASSTPATDAAPVVVIPFEPISRGEKTWMWIVTGLVSVLIVIAMLISEDVIDWPGDGIGRD